MSAAYTAFMLVTFKSQATDDLVMLGQHAEALLKLLGKTATAPGTLTVADMPAALQRLHELHDTRDAVPPHPPSAPQGEDDEPVSEAPPPLFIDEPVSLRQRAAPLVRMIEQAMAEGKPIVWGV